MSSPKTELLHWSAGRTRLKNRDLREVPGLSQRVESTLRAAPGIKTAKVSNLTSALLIEYDSSAWREPQGTRALWAALCELFPESCHADGCTVAIGDLSSRPQVREAVLEAFRTAAGLTEARFDPATERIHIHFDPARFALEPVVLALTRAVES